MQKGPLEIRHLKKIKDYDIYVGNMEACVCLRYKAGETILREGMPMEYLLLIISGKAKVCSSTKEGKDLVLCYYVSDGILGDIEMMMDTFVAVSSVVAITDFECVGVPYKQYASELKQNLAFLNRVGKELSFKLLQSSQNCVFTTLYSGEERLCAYILQTSYDDIFCETLTDVSCTIGTSYRHLLRMLKQLSSDGVLIKKENGYYIADRRELIARAQYLADEYK